MIVKQEGMIDFDGEGMPDDQGGGADRWVLIRQPETGAGEDRLAGGVVRIPAPYVLAAPEREPREAVGATVRANSRGDSLTALTALIVLVGAVGAVVAPPARVLPLTANRHRRTKYQDQK